MRIIKMTGEHDAEKDHWSSEAYTASAGFVPKLASTVLSYLSLSPADRILDLGCGNGELTAHIASLVPDGCVVGLDNSGLTIAAALRWLPNCAPSNLTFKLVDCSRLSETRSIALLHSNFDWSSPTRHCTGSCAIKTAGHRFSPLYTPFSNRAACLWRRWAADLAGSSRSRDPSAQHRSLQRSSLMPSWPPWPREKAAQTNGTVRCSRELRVFSPYESTNPPSLLLRSCSC